MKTRKLAFICLAALLGGCSPIISLHPLLTEENLAFDENLLGTWVEPNEPETTWEFARLDETNAGRLAETYRDAFPKLYHLALTTKSEDQAVKGTFVAALGKLGDHLVLDLFPDQFPSGDQDPTKIPLAYNSLFFVRVHMFYKVDFSDDQLTLWSTDDKALKELLVAEPNAVRYEVVEKQTILTASTKELQEFVTKFANDERLFAHDLPLIRKSD